MTQEKPHEEIDRKLQELLRTAAEKQQEAMEILNNNSEKAAGEK
jgi:hypothetical protein